MDGINVSIRFSGQCIVPNERGELEFESGAGTKTKIQAEELHSRMLQAQTFEEAIEYLQGSGAYVGTDGSRVMIISTPNGAQIFSKDEPGRKMVIDRNLPESAIEQILSINDYDEGRAVEKILIENRIISDPEKETERIVTSDRNGISLEREADNVDSRDVTDNGLIGEARSARDSMENPYRGIYNEEQTQEIIDRRRREREAYERGENTNDRRGGMDR